MQHNTVIMKWIQETWSAPVTTTNVCKHNSLAVGYLLISVITATLDPMENMYNMVFYTTIGSTYFVKTQTYVALFGPHQLSIIFSGVIYLELSPL